MDIIAIAAPYITNPVTVWSVVAFLVFWSVCCGLWFYARTTKLCRALRGASARLARSTNPQQFAADYEGVSAEFSASLILGDRWREFRDTLIKRQIPSPLVQSTSRAHNFFNLSLFRTEPIGVDLRFHAAMPNLLVGAGLLFTFIGLATALHVAGDVVSGEAKARTAALEILLNTASFKFVTSLVGLFLSIVYTVLRKSQLKRADGALDQLNAAFEMRAPLVTAALIQSEANEILARQSTILETFSNDLALSIGSAFDQAFDKRLGEHVAPLTEAMQQLAERMQSSNEGALKTMLDGFVDKLQGGAGDHMDKVAISLSGLGERLEGLQSGLGEAAVRMSQSADAMATRMGEGAEQALGRITDQLGGLAASLQATAEQTRSAGADAGRELAARLEAAAGGFERSASGIAETLSGAASALAANMGQQSEASSARLAAQVEAMGERIASSASGFEQMAARVASALEASASATGGALGKGAEEAVARIATATEGMRSELQAMLLEFRSTLGRASEDLRAGGAAGAASLRDGIGEAGVALATSIAGASDWLAEGGTVTGAALESGGTMAGEAIGRAGGIFGDRAAALGTQVDRVTQAAQSASAHMGSLGAALESAATPLTAISGELKSASQAARASQDAAIRSLEQIGGASQRLEAAGASAGRLIESLNGAVQRFEGVDRELARTLETLKGGLQGFTRDITEAVEKTDSNLASAVNQLASLLNNLNEAIEEMSVAPARLVG